MNTLFKDIAHLYTGCKVLCVYPAGTDGSENWAESKQVDTLTSVSFEECCFLLKDNPDYYFEGDDNEFDLKPILRPLSSMTEKETTEIVLLNRMVKNTLTSVLFDCKFTIKYLTPNGFNPQGGEIDLRQNNPQTFAYLLSVHFDLFGLIESGQAIDATTLNP